MSLHRPAEVGEGAGPTVQIDKKTNGILKYFVMLVFVFQVFSSGGGRGVAQPG
jgi:hypothetical protein